MALALQNHPFVTVACAMMAESVDVPAADFRDLVDRLVDEVREIDQRYLLYVPMPTGLTARRDEPFRPLEDPLLMYSFQGGRCPVRTPGDQWPAGGADIDALCEAWWPYLVFSARHGVGYS